MLNYDFTIPLKLIYVRLVVCSLTIKKITLSLFDFVFISVYVTGTEMIGSRKRESNDSIVEYQIQVSSWLLWSISLPAQWCQHYTMKCSLLLKKFVKFNKEIENWTLLNALILQLYEHMLFAHLQLLTSWSLTIYHY